METMNQAPQPKLMRSRTDKKIFGICGGMAVRWNVDPTLVRVGFAAGLVLTGGFALVVYFVCLAVMPLEPEQGIAGGAPVV